MSFNSNTLPLSCVIKNRDGWQLARKERGPSTTYKLIDPWGLKVKTDLQFIFKEMPEMNSDDCIRILDWKINQIHVHNNRFGFFVQKYQGRVHVIFDSYGLKGGGWWEFLQNFIPSFFKSTIIKESEDKETRRAIFVGTSSALVTMGTDRILNVVARALKIDANPIAKALISTTSHVFGYVTNKTLSDEEMTSRDFILLGCSGFIDGTRESIFQENTSTAAKGLSSLIQGLVLASTNIKTKDKINDKEIGFITSLLLFASGLKLVNDGRLREGSTILGGSIPALKYAFSSKQYNELNFFNILYQGAVVSAATEGARSLLNLKTITGYTISALNQMLKPEIGKSVIGFLQKFASMQLVDRVFTRTIVSMTSTSINSLFLGKVLTFERICVSSFKDSLGTIATHFIMPRSILSRNGFSSNEVYNFNPYHRARDILAMTNMVRAIVGESISCIFGNIMDGKKWTEHLMETLFFRSLIAAADSNPYMNSLSTQIEGLRARYNQYYAEWTQASRSEEYRRLRSVRSELDDIMLNVDISGTFSEVIAPGALDN